MLFEDLRLYIAVRTYPIGYWYGFWVEAININVTFGLVGWWKIVTISDQTIQKAGEELSTKTLVSKRDIMVDMIAEMISVLCPSADQSAHAVICK